MRRVTWAQKGWMEKEGVQGFRHCFMAWASRLRLMYAWLPQQLLMKSFVIASLCHSPLVHWLFSLRSTCCILFGVYSIFHPFLLFVCLFTLLAVEMNRV